MAEITETMSAKCFGGYQKVFSHDSKELKCNMKFAIYLPPKCESEKVPCLYWLSGLTCNEHNFIQKSGAQRYAAEHGVAIVCPDTSPRGCNIEGEEDNFYFGTGAGFYVNATLPKWKENYRMYSYVTEELPALINSNFPVLPDRQSVFGHSMGGHGALICALKNPGKYRSVSALSPVCHPTICPWGKVVLPGYLGDDEEAWKEYDATLLLETYQGPPMEILIDQGKDDKFLQDKQLLPEYFVKACADNQMPVIYRVHEGYDHGYYFIATFIEDHIKHHMKYLQS